MERNQQKLLKRSPKLSKKTNLMKNQSQKNKIPPAQTPSQLWKTTKKSSI